MITGVHAILYTRDAEELRTFLGEVLGFPSVDAGGGWLIFGLPPAEVAAHPADEAGRHELYLMCDDIEATLARLAETGVEPSRPVSDEGWGLVAHIPVPGSASWASTSRATRARSPVDVTQPRACCGVRRDPRAPRAPG